MVQESVLSHSAKEHELFSKHLPGVPAHHVLLLDQSRQLDPRETQNVNRTECGYACH